jgi:hypothetical protein
VFDLVCASPVRHDFAVRRIRAYAAFLTLLLAGCTSSGGSDPTSPPLTTPTTSVSIAPPPSSSSSSSAPAPQTVPSDVPRTGPNTKPGEKPPVMPVAATQHTPDGAKAFAEFFIRTIDWSAATTSATYTDHYYESSCSSCRTLSDSTERARRAGHHYIGGRMSITGVRLSATALARSAEYTAVVTFDITSFEEVTRSGAFVIGDGAHRDYSFEVSMSWRAGSWTVIDLRANT